MIRATLLFTTLLALLAIGVRLVGHGDGRGGGAAAPSSKPVVRASYRGAAAAVPNTWRRVARGDDSASWSSPNRSRSLTLGVVPAAHSPLIAVVTASADDIERAEPDYQQRSITTMRDDAGTVVIHRFSLRARRLEIVQIWRRLPRGRLDVVATWARASGASAAPPFGSPPLPTSTTSHAANAPPQPSTRGG